MSGLGKLPTWHLGSHYPCYLWASYTNSWYNAVSHLNYPCLECSVCVCTQKILAGWHIHLQPFTAVVTHEAPKYEFFSQFMKTSPFVLIDSSLFQKIAATRMLCMYLVKVSQPSRTLLGVLFCYLNLCSLPVLNMWSYDVGSLVPLVVAPQTVSSESKVSRQECLTRCTLLFPSKN